MIAIDGGSSGRGYRTARVVDSAVSHWWYVIDGVGSLVEQQAIEMRLAIFAVSVADAYGLEGSSDSDVERLRPRRAACSSPPISTRSMGSSTRHRTVA